jgi:hypothetical protein
MINVLQLVGAMSLLAGPLWLALGPAAAQSNAYTIQTPGQPPKNASPRTGNEDLVIQAPGRPPLYAKPKVDGTYTIDVPGHPPTIMVPKPGGGFVIQNPGRPPTYVDPGG